MNIGLKLCFCLVICACYMFNVDSIFTTLLSIVLFGILYGLNLKVYQSRILNLLDLLITTLPFSFMPLFGVESLSLFLIIQVCIILESFLLKKSKVTVRQVILNAITFLINIVYIVYSISNPGTYLELIVKTNLFMFLLMNLEGVKLSLTEIKLLNLVRLFAVIGIAGIFAVLTQYLFFTYLGVAEIGNQAQLGEVRKGFSGLFYDYSIMSIYMASCALLFLLFTINGRFIVTKKIDLLLFLLFLSTSVLTSARSGLAAFVLTFVFFLIRERNIKWIVYTTIIGVPLGGFVLYILSINRGENINYDSGRIDNYTYAINFLSENPVFGAGVLGYDKVTGNLLPHNFALDFLVNYGLIISLFLVGLILNYLFLALRNFPKLAFLLLIMMSGGMFHASFINTHYIVVPLMLIIIWSNRKPDQAYQKLTLL